MKRACFFLAGGALFGCVLWGLAQRTEVAIAQAPRDEAAAADVAAPEGGPPLVLRVYDVADLISQAPPRPFTTGPVPATMLRSNRSVAMEPDDANEGNAGRGFFSGGPDDVDDGDGWSAKRLASLLVDLLSSGDLGESAGGDVRVVEHMLVINETEVTHARIAAFLEDLRGSRRASRGVRVEARWLALTPDELADLSRGGEERAEASDSNATVTWGVNGEALRRHGGATRYHAAVRCADAQTVHVVSGRSRTAVVDVDASIGTVSWVYDPKLAFVLDGALLQVTPLLEGTVASVDVFSAVGTFEKPGEMIPLPHVRETWVATTQPEPMEAITRVSGAMAIDRLTLTGQQLTTTVRLPLSRWSLVGGMTLPPAVDDEDGARRDLYLFLRVSADDAPAPAGKQQ